MLVADLQDLQDLLLVVVNGLNLLDGLLAHTMENLMVCLSSDCANLKDPMVGDYVALGTVRGTLRAAVTKLQFQDLVNIVHASKILQGCAYRLASESIGLEDGEAVPFVEGILERPNPVTQDEMDVGSIEFFRIPLANQRNSRGYACL